MKCKCGHELPAGVAYCDVCGAKVFQPSNLPPIVCVHCSRQFSLDDSMWCSCETDTPTYVCPHCGRCACKV